MSHGIIIPCYNESSRLKLKSFIDYAKNNKHVILCFVNDGSSDATRETLAEIKSLEHENVHIFNLAENSGKAKAVQQGALYLYNQTRVNTIGFIDADLSTDFEDYADLLRTMKSNKELKVIYGSRATNGENKIERDGLRSIISMVIRMIILCITRLKIEDTQCGAKVFKRELIPTLFSSEFKTRWLFDVEVLLRLKRTVTIDKFRRLFLEKPLTRWVHMDGSKLGMKDALSIPMSLLKIGWIYNIYYPISRISREPVKLLIMRILQNAMLKLLSTATLLITVSYSLYTQITPDAGVMLFNFITFLTLFTLLIEHIRSRLTKSLRWLWIKAYFKRHFNRLI